MATEMTEMTGMTMKKTYRVRVFDAVYTIRTETERKARSLACGRYVRSHDWFAFADPWKATAGNCEILAD